MNQTNHKQRIIEQSLYQLINQIKQEISLMSNTMTNQDVWNAIKNHFVIDKEDIVRIFGDDVTLDDLREMPVEQVVEILNRNDLQVGDEVITINGIYRGVVVGFDTINNIPVQKVPIIINENGYVYPTSLTWMRTKYHYYEYNSMLNNLKERTDISDAIH